VCLNSVVSVFFFVFVCVKESSMCALQRARLRGSDHENESSVTAGRRKEKRGKERGDKSANEMGYADTKQEK
jgi:hypothetical protein